MMKNVLGSMLISAALLNIGTASAQSIIPKQRLGLYGAAAFNFSNADVQVWQTPINTDPLLSRYANDTLRYDDGSTNVSFVGGLIYGHPINDMFHFTGRLGVNWLNASASADQAISSDSSLTHNLSADLVYLEIAPGVEVYNLFGETPIYLLGGLEFGFNLSSSREQLTDLYVNDDYRAQEVTTGPTEVVETSLRAALMLGAGYTLQLSEKIWLQPEISYRLPLTQISSSDVSSPWKIGQLRLGVNLTFDISSDEKTPEPEKTKASARMDRITTNGRDGREVEVSSINVEDVAYTEMFPLVPYVFYPEKGTLPALDHQSTQFDKEKGNFIPENLPLDAIEVNKNLLNIIGARMQKLPQATLTITGTTDGKAETAIPELGNRRALWAKDYLVNTFGIAPERIALRTTPTPTSPSAPNDPDGVVENRRIEFSSNVPDVLMPVTITADNQRVATPDIVNFHPVVEGTDSVKTWTLTMSQAGRPLRSMNGNGQPSRVTWSIKPNEMSTAQVPVDYEFTATTSDGQEVNTTGSVPVDYLSSVRKKTENLPDRTIDKYSLILFDFDKATLNADNQRILEQAVLPSIKSNSTVSIIGYTDRIGGDEYNKKLSRERAATVQTFLQSRARDAKYTVLGVGESTEVFNNNSPIGRQLSRTVQVIVDTPKR